MAKYFFKIQYNNIEIVSDPVEFNDKEFEDIKIFLQKAVKGEIAYIETKHNGNLIYVPNSILINSFISINKVD